MVRRKEKHDRDKDLVDHRDRVADDAEYPRQSERRVRELPRRSPSEEHKPRRYRVPVCVGRTASVIGIMRQYGILTQLTKD